MYIAVLTLTAVACIYMYSPVKFVTIGLDFDLVNGKRSKIVY